MCGCACWVHAQLCVRVFVCMINVYVSCVHVRVCFVCVHCVCACVCVWCMCMCDREGVSKQQRSVICLLSYVVFVLRLLFTRKCERI